MAGKKRVSNKKRKQRSKLLKYDGLKDVNVSDLALDTLKPEPLVLAPEPPPDIKEKEFENMELGISEVEEEIKTIQSKSRCCCRWAILLNLCGVGGVVAYFLTR